MTKKRYVGIILCAMGAIVTAIASLWQSYLDKNLMSHEGPYAMTVGIVGVVILMAGIYYLTWPPTWK